MSITILHLSDIQYGRHHVDKAGHRRPIYPDVDYSPQLEKMKADLDILKREDVHPGFIAITGDIAEWSLRTEYEQASKFLAGLVDYLGIDRRHVVMVPGNHDINRKLCQSSRLMAEAEETPFVPPYYPKFRFYAEFFNEFYMGAHFPADMEPYRFSEKDLFVNFCFPEQGIAFAGLNSCIDESESDHYGNVTVEQLKKAATRLNTIDPERKMIRVAVMHHNFVRSSENDAENLRDADELKPTLFAEDFSLVLHGHQHLPRQEVVGKGDVAIHVLATGSAGLDGETIPEIARRYQVIDIRENRVRVFRRCFDNAMIHTTGKGVWKPDLAPDQTTLYDSFTLPSKSNVILDTLVLREDKPDIPLRIPESYKIWISDHCRDMALTKLIGTSSVIRASLPEIFIPLYANPPMTEEKHIERDEMMMMRDRGEDIENLMADKNCLVIEGLAGSGKTTLIKHFSWMLIQSGEWKGLEEYLPVLVFLKDLRHVDLPDGPPNASAAEAILSGYFHLTDNGLDIETVQRYRDSGKAIFLLDGLDEISPELRSRVADSFAAFRRKYSGCRMILAGRPHGVDGTIVKWFGENHVRVLPLALDQVETFIGKWFAAVFERESRMVDKSAQGMIGEIRAQPAIGSLIDNPLMLTAICLLYLDDKELPGQRAELYLKFIENLLHRRFPEPEKIRNYLMTLAHVMHFNRDRGIDRVNALEILARGFERDDEEPEMAYKRRMEEKFDEIEPACALMSCEDGQYGFRHLTFQEFLTAFSLVAGVQKDFSEAIRDLWADDWYAEVIDLYIGYLSLNNRGIANSIVREVLEASDEIPFSKWRLASRALMDVHRDRRERPVVELARERLWHIAVSEAEPKVRAEAGEILGWLGDKRNLKEFIPVKGGTYHLSQGVFDIEDFEIGKYPVTNSWFAEFVKDGGYENLIFWSEQGIMWLNQTKCSSPYYWHNRIWNGPNLPVVGVCWYEAYAFTMWMTAACDDGFAYFLPDENQRKAASFGFERREYPWGNWQEGCCNSEEIGIGKTSPVGIFEKGNTPDGISDLAGNVRELTCSDYHTGNRLIDFKFDKALQKLNLKLDRSSGAEKKEYIDEIVCRYADKGRQLPVTLGSSWFYSHIGSQCSERDPTHPNNYASTLGFRCARIKL